MVKIFNLLFSTFVALPIHTFSDPCYSFFKTFRAQFPYIPTSCYPHLFLFQFSFPNFFISTFFPVLNSLYFYFSLPLTCCYLNFFLPPFSYSYIFFLPFRIKPSSYFNFLSYLKLFQLKFIFIVSLLYSYFRTFSPAQLLLMRTSCYSKFCFFQVLAKPITSL